MKIEILGIGCKSCENLYRAAVTAVDELGGDNDIEVVKVSDINYFSKMGVFMTPGLVIDGEVLSSGKVLNAGQVKAKIEERLSSCLP
jgi:small redox-active disulfide protein 2